MMEKMIDIDLELTQVLDRCLANEKISIEEGVRLFDSFHLNSLGAAADEIRRNVAGDPVTFIIDTNINYTNICISGCKFCAFYRNPDSKESYVLAPDEILEKIARAKTLGATQVLMQGGLNPELDIEYYEGIIRRVKEKFPEVQRHFFSPSEIHFIAETSVMSIDETLGRLVDAGLMSIPGGGAEILEDHVRKKISPNKIPWKTWKDVMVKAQKMGLPTSATMVYGLTESYEDRVRHLLRIKEIQDKYHGFTAFIPWSFKPGNTALAKKYNITGESGGVEYLKVLAISRLILGESIRNVQASWLTQGKDVASVALSFGANDFGGTMIEENVVKSTGYETNYLPHQEIIRIIESTGRKAAQRDTLYNILERY